MKINNKQVTGNKFAYDGCHKIYICEDENDIKEAVNLNYAILDIRELKAVFYSSCPLRFIDNWKLDKCYAEQLEIPEFEY